MPSDTRIIDNQINFVTPPSGPTPEEQAATERRLASFLALCPTTDPDFHMVRLEYGEVPDPHVVDQTPTFWWD